MYNERSFRPDSLEKGEKTKGREALLRDLERRSDELTNKKNRAWITEAQYSEERQKLDDERLEILTHPG